MTRTTIPRTLAVTPRMEEAWQAVDACFGCFRLTAGAVPHVRLSGGPPGPTERSNPARGHKRSRPLDVGKHRDWQPLGAERKSDRQPYPGRRPTIALAHASIETRPLASIGTCSRTRDLSCVTSAVAIVMSIGARLGAAIVVDQ